MKKRIKERWVKALRSGKYKQGKGYLCKTTDSGEEYCCLGVLCDLYINSKAGKRTNARFIRDNCEIANNKSFVSDDSKEEVERTLALVKEVQDWAGLNDSDPILRKRDSERASALNDRGYTFKQIAVFIERNL